MILSPDKKGVPVFMIGEKPLSYADGIKQIKYINRITSEDLGQILGVSGRTVEGWIDGKKPGIKRLLYLTTITNKYGVLLNERR